MVGRLPPEGYVGITNREPGTFPNRLSLKRNVVQ